MSERLKTKKVEEIPPVTRASTGTKYDYLFEDAEKKGKIEVPLGDRKKASSLTAYLRRVADEEKFNVTQRLESVFIESLS